MNQKESSARSPRRAHVSRASARCPLGSKIAMVILALPSRVSVLAFYVSPYGPDEIFDKWEHSFQSTCSNRPYVLSSSRPYWRTFSLMIGPKLDPDRPLRCDHRLSRPCASPSLQRSCASWTSSWRCPVSPWRSPSWSSGARRPSPTNTFIWFVIICSIAFAYILQLSRTFARTLLAAYGETTSVR